MFLLNGETFDLNNTIYARTAVYEIMRMTQKQIDKYFIVKDGELYYKRVFIGTRKQG